MSMTVERISALLAKAERTDNEHEAAAYLMKAQSLATVASIDLAAARARQRESEGPAEPVTRTVTIGEKGKRANTHMVSLFVVIAHANSTIVDVAHDSTYVVAYGMPHDIDSVHALFASLAVQMTASAQRYLDAGAWRGETYRASVRGRRVTKEFTKQTARVTFYRSYVQRIDERLTQARESAIRERDDQDAGHGAALVLRQSEDDVRRFHRRSSEARGRWGGYRGAARSATGSAAGAGRSAASSARLAQSDELPGGRRILEH